jgi:hypothetical protein
MFTRVAFCISGQFRDDHLTLPKTASLAREVGATVFVSTWRRRGAKSTGIINHDQAERIFGHAFARALPSRLCNGTQFNLAVPGMAMRLEENAALVSEDQVKAYFPEAVVDIEDENLCLDFCDPGVQDTNSLRMLYKIWRCNELKRAAEKRQGAPFDIVVRFRPDIVPRMQSVQLAMAADLERTIFIPDAGRPAGWFNDILAISSSATADHYAGLFGKAVLAPHRNWNVIHRELFSHLEEINVSAKPIEIERHITQDLQQRQPRAREALLELIAAERVTEGFFPDIQTWRTLHRLLIAAHRSASGANASEVLQLVHDIDLAGEDNEFLGQMFEVVSSTLGRSGEPVAAFVTCAMALVCLADKLGIGVLAAPWARRDFVRAVANLPPLMIAQSVAPGFVEQIIRTADVHITIQTLIEIAIRRVGPTRLTFLSEHVGSFQSDSIDALSNLFRILIGQDREAARGVAETMALRFPADWRGSDHLGHYYSACGDTPRALTLSREAHALEPTHGGLTCRVGELLLATGAYAEATNWLKQAAEMWTDPRPWVLRADALERVGDLLGAKQVILEAIALFPDNRGLRDRLGRLVVDGSAA